jgi:DNA replication and repair protein RecF
VSQHQISNIEVQGYDFNRVQSLKLNNFRSYDTLDCTFRGCSVVLLGSNGSGKTNILESLSLLSPGRGLRRAPFEQFRNFKGPAEWGINATVLSNNSSYKISTGIPAGRIKGREVRINDKKVFASKSLPEIISVSWLTPSMDQIFVESPSSRRKFLDTMCSSLFNNHASLIKSYEKLMRERNILLQENKFDIDWLDTLETQMSQDGVNIGLNRLNLITGLNTRLDNDENPVWPKAFLKIEGIIEDKLSSNDCESVKDFFRERLFDNRKKDFFSGRTTFGIHKSDLLVSDRNKGIYANQCSTGEQKSLLIGLILTHLNLVANRSNRYPILLLDEVVAHLDQLRRAALFEQIIETKAQVFMTGTEIDLFSGIKDFSEIFSVGMGRLKKIN